MRLAYLGSGSRGNAALIENGNTCIMLDCGFSVAQTEKRLARLDRKPGDLTAILVTHEHSDHIRGVGALSRKYDLPVWLTPGTFEASRDCAFAELGMVDRSEPFCIGDISVMPMAVPHDAREPCQYIFGEAPNRLAVLTDTGHVTTDMGAVIAGCSTLAIECNHDRELLRTGPYHASLKTRVGGHLGHLSNEQAAEFAKTVNHAQLKHVVALHLSETNNRPELAQRALAPVLGLEPEDILIADQYRGLGWLEV